MHRISVCTVKFFSHENTFFRDYNAENNVCVSLKVLGKFSVSLISFQRIIEEDVVYTARLQEIMLVIVSVKQISLSVTFVPNVAYQVHNI